MKGKNKTLVTTKNYRFPSLFQCRGLNSVKAVKPMKASLKSNGNERIKK